MLLARRAVLHLMHEFSRHNSFGPMMQYTNSGQIHLIAGPMFSGKTTELLRLCNRYSLAKRKVVIVKYARDNRYDDVMLCTHDLRKMDAISALRISDVHDQLLNHDVIGIDEGQFFEDVCEIAESLADMGKIVIVAALSADYKREPFSIISRLFALAEKVDKLNAVCRYCGDSASFTVRTMQCEKREVIGGQELYQAACRHCYLSLNKNIFNYNTEHETTKATLKNAIKASSPVKTCQKDSKSLTQLKSRPSPLY